MNSFHESEKNIFFTYLGVKPIEDFTKPSTNAIYESNIIKFNFLMMF